MSTPSPFALILPSRPVHTAPIAVSPTQYAFTIPAAPAFTHLVLFLLPGITLPPDTLAAVYIQFPGATGEFRFLGAIGNEKQSAIFRIEREQTTGVSSQGEVTIGVSVEATASIQVQLATLQSSPSTALVLANQGQGSRLSTKILAQRIIQNAFNFLASFAGSSGPGDEEVIPLRSFKTWWEKFERKVATDPSFLERDGDG